MRHTVVISDIHLCEVARGTGLWMRYRQAALSPDPEIAAMLAEARRRVRGERLSFVLDGDIFDFDAPRVREDGEDRFHDDPRDAAHAVPAMRAILDDHPVFVRALGELLAEGHEVVFVSGNHDVQLDLPEVREALAERVIAAAKSARNEGMQPAFEVSEGDDLESALRSRLLFRAWFHKTEDGIVIEHGNQYDGYSCWRYPTAPFGRDGKTIVPNMSSLAARHLVSRMGYFNPHVDDSFMLSLSGYLAHWLRYYAFSKRTLASAWAMGAVKTVISLLRFRERPSRARFRAMVQQVTRETGASVRQVVRHARLFARPSEDKMHTVLRELWLDRITMGATALLFVLAWFSLADGPLLLGAAIAPAAVAGYEVVVPKEPLDALWKRVQRVARQVAKIHGARAVIFGHTHKAEGTWEDGVFLGNTGSWSAAYRDLECTIPVDRARPVVWLRSDGERIEGGLVRWREGRFEEG